MLAPLRTAGDREAVRFGDRALTYDELRGAAGAVAVAVAGRERVAVWATSELETCVAVAGALLAGVPVVPLNPRSGSRDLEHVFGDSTPELLLHAPGTEPPEAATAPRHVVDVAARECGDVEHDPGEEATAFVVYTSGTTGPPKGVLMPRRAVRTNLDALAEAWGWTAEDRLVHGLPLFHVHGLVLGLLGPLRLGGSVEHLGRFSPQALADALRRGGTMAFGVPTMYGRLADEAEGDPAITEALRSARVLVSGSAPLPAAVHARFERLCGQRIVERYGMSETLMNTAVRADGERRAGYVGLPLPGVQLRLLDDDGGVIETSDDETIGEIAVRGPNVMTGYLGRPEATAEVLSEDGWFRTGDLATRAADGYVRIVGRRATDLIKSGGFKIGAGEIESALLEHPGVAQVAVTGEPDDDLGERVVAWVVPAGDPPDAQELVDHVASLLAVHKRPRVVRFLDDLPRNDMGKVQKRALSADPDATR